MPMNVFSEPPRGPSTTVPYLLGQLSLPLDEDVLSGKTSGQRAA